MLSRAPVATVHILKRERRVTVAGKRRVLRSLGEGGSEPSRRRPSGHSEKMFTRATSELLFLQNLINRSLNAGTVGEFLEVCHHGAHRFAN